MVPRLAVVLLLASPWQSLASNLVRLGDIARETQRNVRRLGSRFDVGVGRGKAPALRLAKVVDLRLHVEALLSWLDVQVGGLHFFILF